MRFYSRMNRPKFVACLLAGVLITGTFFMLLRHMLQLVHRVGTLDDPELQAKLTKLREFYADSDAADEAANDDAVDKVKNKNSQEDTVQKSRNAEAALPVKRSRVVGLTNKFSTRDRQILVRLLQRIYTRLHALHIPYFMDADTLLGSYRHHDLIPWDDDVDLAVPLEMRARVRAEFAASSQHGGGGGGGSDVRLHSLRHLDRIYRRDTRGRRRKYPSPLKSNNADNNNRIRWGFPYVNVCYFTGNSTHVTRPACYSGDPITYSVEMNRVFPLHRRPFFMLDMMAPADSYHVLRAMMTRPDTQSCLCRHDGYSHMLERRVARPVERQCALLREEFPFVRRRRARRHRSALDGNGNDYNNDNADGVASRVGIVEELTFGENVLHSVTIDEPVYAITEHYCLRLIDSENQPR